MIDLRAINRLQFASAKRWWTAAILTKLVIFGLGALAIFVATPHRYLPQFLLLLAILSEVFQLRSDGIKGKAEGLLRRLDLCQSFGREISQADQRDILLWVSRAERKRIEQAPMQQPYFESAEAPGPRRAVENLIESAWYTRHQAEAMFWLYGILIVALLLLSLALLLVAIRDVASAASREQVIKLVTSWLLLIVSLNMLKSVWAYFKMTHRCERTELTCEHLLDGEVSETDALKQWLEYQVARASCPLLPSWLWKVREAKLNEAWRVAQQG